MYVEAEISTGEDGTERLIDTLSLIDAVMPDVVSSRKQGPIKAEPGSSMDSPSVAPVEGTAGTSDPMDVDGTTEIPPEKSTVLKVSDSFFRRLFFWYNKVVTLGPRQRGVHLCLESKTRSVGQWQWRQHSQDMELEPVWGRLGRGVEALHHECGGQGGSE